MAVDYLVNIAVDRIITKELNSIYCIPIQILKQFSAEWLYFLQTIAIGEAMSDTAPRIILPEKPFFILTIDTEEEWDWSGDFPHPPFSTKNIEQIPKFQAFCHELGVLPTYFVDHAVASNSEHAAILRQYFEDGRCDIGAHLHPWANPPIEESINEANSHAINLPIDLFERKISILTQKLTDTFGQHPYSYRAGRWGVNSQHLKVLSENGYRVDSSVRPFYREQYFSYTSAPTTPYWPSMQDALREDNRNTCGILEIPVTSGYNLSNYELLDKVHTTLSAAPLNNLRLVGILWRLGLLRKTTITPEGTEPADVCRCIDSSIKRGDRIINMFFHSSDLLPGCTPYVQSETDKTRFMDVIKQCVEHVRKKYDGQMTTMRDIRHHLTGTS